MSIVGRTLRSTALSYAQYDEDTETLTVDFVNGRTYTHEGVPKNLYDQLVEAPSPGQFYNSFIRGAF